jgi:hypothetical protein
MRGLAPLSDKASTAPPKSECDPSSVGFAATFSRKGRRNRFNQLTK